MNKSFKIIALLSVFSLPDNFSTLSASDSDLSDYDSAKIAPVRRVRPTQVPATPKKPGSRTHFMKPQYAHENTENLNKVRVSSEKAIEHMVDSYERQIAQLEANHQAELSQVLSDAQENWLQQLKENGDKIRKRSEKRTEAQIETYKTALNRTIDQLLANQIHDRNEFEKIEKESADAKRDLEQAIVDIDLARLPENHKIKAQLLRHAEELTKKAEEEAGLIRTQAKKDIDDLTTQHKKILHEKEELHGKHIAHIHDQHTQNVEKLKQDHEKKVSVLQSSHEGDRNKALENLKKQYDKLLQDSENSLKEQIKGIEREHEKQIKELESKYAGLFAAHKETCEKMVAEEIAKHKWSSLPHVLKDQNLIIRGLALYSGDSIFSQSGKALSGSKYTDIGLILSPITAHKSNSATWWIYSAIPEFYGEGYSVQLKPWEKSHFALDKNAEQIAIRYLTYHNQASLSDRLKDIMQAHLGIHPENSILDLLEGKYSSGLIASTLEELGLMQKDKHHAEYLPGEFSMEHAHVPFSHGVELGAEIIAREKSSAPAGPEAKPSDLVSSMLGVGVPAPSVKVSKKK